MNNYTFRWLRSSLFLGLVGLGWLLVTAAAPQAGYPREWFLNAHNCYPSKGIGADRLVQARRAGLSAFELDVVWSEGRGQTVVSHEKELFGSEPTVHEYFFVPLLPELRRLPADQPRLLLLLDFKTDHPGPVKEVYDLLWEHQQLLTTAGEEVRWGPLTVILTGNNTAIAMFEALSPKDGPYLAMGNREPLNRQFREDIAEYFTAPATAFYRVFNFEWIHIERDPNPKAGSFTPAERARLRALVEMAHRNGYWLRTWTLNATSLAWGSGRNFGSRDAVLERWRAARDAGVENVATDEYELAGEFMASEDATLPTRRSTR